MGARGGGAAFLHVLGVAVAPDPVVELLAIGLLAPPQHRQRPPRLLHHVHDAVQQLRGNSRDGEGALLQAAGGCGARRWAGGFGLRQAVPAPGCCAGCGSRGCSGEKPREAHGGDGGQSGGTRTRDGAGTLRTLLRCFHSSAHSRSVSRWSITSSCRVPCTAARQERSEVSPAAGPLSLQGGPSPVPPRARGQQGSPAGRWRSRSSRGSGCR